MRVRPLRGLGPRVAAKRGMWSKLLRGLVGGLVGTVPHSAVLLIARRAGWLGRIPPRAITDEVVESFGADPGEGSRVLLSIANHVGFGAGTGALFGLVTPRMSRPAGVLAGMAYGVVVWLASYHGWVPAIGALPKIHRDRKDRQITLLVAHLAFGAALGAIAAWPQSTEPDDDEAEDTTEQRR